MDGLIKNFLNRNRDILAEQKEPDYPKGRIKGIIIKIKLDKGWGFISSDDLAFYRIFFFWTDLEPSVHISSLKLRQEVEFEVKYNPDKPEGKRYSARKIILL